MIAVLVVFEALHTNASRPIGAIALTIIVVLGFATAMAPLVIATELLGELPGITAHEPLEAQAAAMSTLIVAGPAFLIGLAWLAVGRVMVLRDIERRG